MYCAMRAMNAAPFLEQQQLSEELSLTSPDELHRSDRSFAFLPSQPRVNLQPSELNKHLQSEFLTPKLDRLAPKLRFFITPRYSHISPLHHQAVRGRNIILTENPQLHLVWYYDRIFIKPIPVYLFSYAFWQYIGKQTPQVRKAATGFMRTYIYLIRHESDFLIAKEKGLIPRTLSSSDTQDAIGWESFVRFIDNFDQYSDEDVSARYSFGELRLTRLNFWTRIFLGKLTFHHVNAQWGPFLNSFLTPFLSVFAIVTIILNAMQVELAAQSVDNSAPRWKSFTSFSKFFSVMIIVFTAIITISVAVIVTIMMVHDVFFAFRIIRGKKRDSQKGKWKEKKSGIV